MNQELQLSDRRSNIMILMPVYNDWQSAEAVIRQLNSVLDASGYSLSVLVVDDGSSVPAQSFSFGGFTSISSVKILRLRRNLGHQRAICIGLAYAEKNTTVDCVVVMDADGEDQPSDVPRLLAKWESDERVPVVFAERWRRSEGFVFRVSYGAYRFVHRTLTGRGVRVGNFSVLPVAALRTLVVVSELWSHYAAAVFVSGQPFTMIPTSRGLRLSGKSTMNFQSLVVHGLSAISVFADVVGVRLLFGAITAAVIAGLGIAVVVWIRVFTTLAVPGWATYTTGILFVVLLQAIMLAFGMSVALAANRKDASALPTRDYLYFVDRVDSVFEAPQQTNQLAEER